MSSHAPSEDVERELRTLFNKWYAEKSQNQTPTAQTPKKYSSKQLLRALLEDRDLPPSEPSPRNLYSYADQRSRDFLVQINEELFEETRKEAEQRKMSVSSYVRECLLYRLRKTSPDKELEIERLLEECRSPEDTTFVIEGKKGFLNQTAERGLTGSVWTPSQIDKVALRLHTSPTSTIDQCIEAMNLDKMQTQYFIKQIEYLRNTQPKQEQVSVTPFGVCDNEQCHRPLTKDQFNLPNCPYCNGTKAILFLYDKESPAQSDPYAMCAKCHRPLPKEARTWKECKYCGTTDKEIVLTYEGIQRQTPSSTLKLDKEILEKVTESEQASEESEET